MYEPLWLCKDYKKIYKNFLFNLNKSKKKIFIIYLNGYTKKLLDIKDFQKYNFKLIEMHKHGTKLFNRTLFIYSN